MDPLYVITMPDNSVWHVPAMPVIYERAAYYAARDAEQGDQYEEVYDREVAHCLANPEEGVDWMRNNMYWHELGAVQVKQPDPPNYTDLFGEADVTFEDFSS